MLLGNDSKTSHLNFKSMSYIWFYLDCDSENIEQRIMLDKVNDATVPE